METVVSNLARNPRLVLATILLLATAACSSASKVRPEGAQPPRVHTDDGASPSSASTIEEYGPPLSSDSQPPLIYGPEPLQVHPITLVFGPGMARGFAHIGALRALAANKIPIQAVYGAEMGGLMAALYATDANINHFEWRLARLKDETFMASPSLLGKFFSHPGEANQGDVGKLDEQLKQIFGKQDVSESKMPLWIAVQRKNTVTPSLVNKGALTSVLRVAVAGVGYFGPGTLDGQPAQAASDAAAVLFLCAEAKAQGGSPVVFVDTATLRNDPSSADLVIHPELQDIAPGDFNKRTDTAFRGKKAIEDHLPEIRRLVGLPQVQE